LYLLVDYLNMANAIGPTSGTYMHEHMAGRRAAGAQPLANVHGAL